MRTIYWWLCWLGCVLACNTTIWSPIFLFFSQSTHTGLSDLTEICLHELQTMSLATAQTMGWISYTELTDLPIWAIHGATDMSLLDSWGCTPQQNYSGIDGPLLNTRGELLANSLEELWSCESSSALLSPILTIQQHEIHTLWWWGADETPCTDLFCDCSSQDSLPCGSISQYDEQQLLFDQGSLFCLDQAHVLCATAMPPDHSSISWLCNF